MGRRDSKSISSSNLRINVLHDHGIRYGWPSPTLLKMVRGEAPLVLTITQTSWMVSLMLLGHFVSPLPTGFLMDWFGRKRTCIYLSILPFTSWFMIFFASSAVDLYIARFTAGLWIGVTTTVMPLYVGEIASPKIRDSLMTINNLLMNLGVLFSYVIGPYVSYHMLAFCCECLTIFYFCLFFPMPESPHYYLRQQRREDAYRVLSWLRKGESEENIESEINRIEKAIEEQKLQKGTLKDIFFDDGNRKAITISITYAILKRMSGSSVMQAYASLTLPDKTLKMLSPNTCVIIIGFISLFSALSSTALAVRYRRRVLLTVSGGGCALTMAIVAVWFFLNNYTSVSVAAFSDIVFLSIALYYFFFNIGLGPNGTSIKGEIFSANVKALSSSLTSLVVAFTGFLMNEFYLIIADSFGMYINFIIFSVASSLAVVFTWTYMPDTHNKTLEEIREILSDSKNKQHSNDSSSKN
ncbi:LOW QUALITY PROTEIN: facilitated trehalose transporter Tret1-like [Homalodisca vitripennis]|uniref:LOW QUALITY PROTEIN: facilitated trehalose transporter Tret1-like n=1 Tax=Homalodisca vitripennis TaxID=197043 RepID=UPI001EEBF3B3|nr:LOW QUALITY PROTEIN: facilitated trehalose transporter Tret1-like [Homalodisca vitripennis]